MSETHTMRQRFAAQSVIEVLLLEQSLIPPRSRFARIAGRSPLGGESMPWYLGAQGEIVVAGLLAGLPGGWTVFHAVPVRTRECDIDHLLVGPAGVFTITTKLHRAAKIWVAHRTLMVGRDKQPYIRDAEFEAYRLTRMLRDLTPLRTSVRPVVAFVDSKRITISERPAQVKIIDAAELRRWLTTLPTVLGPAERVALVTLIDSPETWSALPAIEPDELRERFLLLDEAVREARRRRIGWVMLGAALIGAALTLVVIVSSPLGASLL